MWCLFFFRKNYFKSNHVISMNQISVLILSQGLDNAFYNKNVIIVQFWYLNVNPACALDFAP